VIALTGIYMICQRVPSLYIIVLNQSSYMEEEIVEMRVVIVINYSSDLFEEDM
jgi:hypothetical protein